MVSYHTICIAIRQFQSSIDNIIVNIKNVYINYKLFMSFGNLKCWYYFYSIFLIIFDTCIFIELDLDNCSKKKHCVFFNMTCYWQIIESKSLKFDFIS